MNSDAFFRRYGGVNVTLTEIGRCGIILNHFICQPTAIFTIRVNGGYAYRRAAAPQY